MSERLSRVEFVARKYRLNDRAFIEMKVEGVQLGAGPVMSPACFQKFVDGDPSGNQKYLEWMIFQAGGGQETMEKSTGLWDGEGTADTNSLRLLCRNDYITEHVKGFVDDDGKKHKPIAQAEAEALWVEEEEKNRLEFIMGDQDIAYEDGYGFYREWPGKEKIYERVLDAVCLWHTGMPKLKAQNEQVLRYLEMQKLPKEAWTPADQKLAAKFGNNVPKLVELDLYKGWSPSGLLQPDAAYKNLEDLSAVLTGLRVQQVMTDCRHEVVYEDDVLIAVCPLTIGASMKFGSIKWCTANKSEFERSFDGRSGITHHWKAYSEKGPLVYVRFKRDMPEYLSMCALHIDQKRLKNLKHPWSGDGVTFVDLLNAQSATTYTSIVDKILTEHNTTRYSKGSTSDLTGPVVQEDQPVAFENDALTPANENLFRWAGRKPGRAWERVAVGQEVAAAFDRMLLGVQAWGKTFDPAKVESDHLSPSRALGAVANGGV